MRKLIAAGALVTTSMFIGIAAASADTITIVDPCGCPGPTHTVGSTDQGPVSAGATPPSGAYNQGNTDHSAWSYGGGASSVVTFN